MSQWLSLVSFFLVFAGFICIFLFRAYTLATVLLVLGGIGGAVILLGAGR